MCAWDQAKDVLYYAMAFLPACLETKNYLIVSGVA